MIDARQLIREYELTPNKALGQNFLIDEAALYRIVELANANGEAVLEIGPGLGTLTDELSKKASCVVAVEIDKKMVELLDRTLAGRSNINIVNRDFLRIKNAELLSLVDEKEFIVCANLPYYITSPAALKLIDSDLPIKRLVLMMQQEAAEHFTASPRAKCYTPLSVLAQAYYNISPELKLTPSSYYPPPKVNSAVLLLERRFGTEYSRSLSRLVKTAFSMRRKTLYNNLSSLAQKDVIVSALESAALPISCRAEELSYKDFIRLNCLIEAESTDV